MASFNFNSKILKFREIEMGKDRKKKGDEKPKKSDFKAFLKKRAPIYLGLIALFAVFVIPELTKGDLESSFPELSAEEQQIVDIIMEYNGPNGSGLTVMEAISNKINEKYPDEKKYVEYNNWMNKVYEDMEEYFQSKDFFYQMGTIKFTAEK